MDRQDACLTLIAAELRVAAATSLNRSRLSNTLAGLMKLPKKEPDSLPGHQDVGIAYRLRGSASHMFLSVSGHHESLRFARGLSWCAWRPVLIPWRFPPCLLGYGHRQDRPHSLRWPDHQRRWLGRRPAHGQICSATSMCNPNSPLSQYVHGQAREIRRRLRFRHGGHNRRPPNCFDGFGRSSGPDLLGQPISGPTHDECHGGRRLGFSVGDFEDDTDTRR